MSAPERFDYSKLGQPAEEAPRSSLKLTTNAKGKVQPEFKQYVGDDNDAVQALIANAQENFDRVQTWLSQKGLLPA